MLELTPHTATDFLRGWGAIESSEIVEVRELSGGVSNTVLLVHRPDSPGNDFVLKQALPRLKVQQEWFCSIERIWREVEVLDICGSLVTNGDASPKLADWKATVPQVLFADRANYCYAMTAAPAGHQTWKELLLSGQVDPAIASACGTLLGTLHAGSWRNPEIAARLENRTFFDSLRLDPYYRRLAVVHPDLAVILSKLVDDTYSTRLCLVHGDFSPKNLLISLGQIWLIDFEVGHFGDPAFDLGFFLTHLALKAVHAGERRDSYLNLIDIFWNSYQAALLTVVSPDELTNLSRRSSLHWSCCMLARVDGKSPVDYLSPGEQKLMQQFARKLIVQPPSSIEGELARIAELR